MSDPSAPAADLAHHTRQFQELTTYARRHLDMAFARGRPQTMRNAARFLLDCYATYHRWLEQHETENENEAVGVPYPDYEIERAAIMAVFKTHPEAYEDYERRLEQHRQP